MFDIDLVTIIIEILNFLALSALLYHFLFRPVMHTIEKRAAEKERLSLGMIADREEAEKLRDKVKARLEQIEDEVTDIIAKAQDQIESERTSMLEAVQSEAERILTVAQKETHQMQKQAMDEFHDELLDNTLNICGQIIAQNSPQELHDNLVQQFSDRIWELGRSEMRQVETIRRSLDERDPMVFVASARKLSPEQQRLLVRTFSALVDRNVNLELSIDPSLYVGMRVRIADLIVDNSIATQLEKLRDDVSSQLKEYALDE